MPLMLCSLSAKPEAISWVDIALTATARAVFNHLVFIVYSSGKSGSEPTNFV
ncbi:MULTISPECIES: hypothetical protein [Stutzerimonas]|uniref:hypothetical protein n=1 Tax=Stutzerimonas TaxID=2901164 RepID=UPI001F1C06B7|nr:hypothetical protein [Stutzerimonas balearica]